MNYLTDAALYLTQFVWGAIDEVADFDAVVYKSGFGFAQHWCRTYIRKKSR